MFASSSSSSSPSPPAYSSLPARSSLASPIAMAPPNNSSSSPAISSSPSPSSLKARLAQGHRLYGAFLCSSSPTIAEILGWSGYDYVVVDLEHGQGDVPQALPCLRALSSTRTPAIVRVACNDPALIKKTLDLGPDGIMVPMIESASHAAMAVSACRYPPRGIRGAAHPVVRASRYGLDPAYLSRCEQDQEILVILQIETEAAVGCIPEIASVDGVDCLMVGPTDLSASVGYLHDPGHVRVKELQHRAEKAVLSAGGGVYLAGFAMRDDPPADLFGRGCHMVSGAVDIALLRDSALADLKANKPR